MTAVLVDRVRSELGETGVERLLARARSPRSAEYLENLANWISFEEGTALLFAGAIVTGDEQFAFNTGLEASERLGGSPVAALLRSLGSIEEVWRHLTATVTKFNTVTTQELIHVEPGYARIKMGARDGFPRSALHCQYSQGLMSGVCMLFGLAPAKVTHEHCEGEGEADGCVYDIAWDPNQPADASQGNVEIAALKSQLNAMTERLQSMFATASDLIASDDLDMTLARITDRAALEVRAPAYLLAVRPTPQDEMLIHFKGCTEHEAREAATRALNADPESLPESWLLARVGSSRHTYGCLVAMHESGDRFFQQEGDLLEVYARYAATALDSATSLREAKRRHAEADTLLTLARSLTVAGTSFEIAMRVCEAVPFVVDCDRTDFLLRDAADERLETVASVSDRADIGLSPEPISSELADSITGHFADRPSGILFTDTESGGDECLELLYALDARSAAIVPIRAHGQFLGAVIVSAKLRPKRLAESEALADLLTGVAAHATSAIENGMLIDRITFQALHDDLTGLANRASFSARLASAAQEADAGDSRFTLFYLDLDLFKSINDQLGHDVGDELLCQVAKRLNSCVRGDDMAARLGGDEFAVIISGTDDPAIAAAVERRIVNVFERPFEIRGNVLDVGVSIGRADWREHAHDIDALVRHADTQMYDVKRDHHDARPELLDERRHVV